MKYAYYVALCKPNSTKIKYITKVNKANKTWLAENSLPALAMGKTEADDLLYGLTANGIMAMVVKVPNFAEFWNEKEY